MQLTAGASAAPGEVAGRRRRKGVAGSGLRLDTVTTVRLPQRRMRLSHAAAGFRGELEGNYGLTENRGRAGARATHRGARHGSLTPCATSTSAVRVLCAGRWNCMQASEGSPQTRPRSNWGKAGVGAAGSEQQCGGGGVGTAVAVCLREAHRSRHRRRRPRPQQHARSGQ